MLYHLFIRTMNFLNLSFGYEGAIRVKILSVLIAGAIIETFVSVWMTVDFFLNVRINPLLKPKAVLIAPTEDNPRYTTNPKNTKEAVEVFIRYQLIRIFHKSDIAIGNLRLILLAYALLIFLLLFFAILLSWWVYLPPTVIF
ncbi:hypothetical protein SBF1_8120002 [Candidatus Desulfosporosinus infrequens]|uniref:Uncharacterized protein n=1 Tax=Candidatus Desulfosporosinus infrequens TaxID=2043169 RepID=A0A2U3LTW2_9FIRM|nr:hypothetical protein SBF1_8120002 [Candidatus Desulfosporosinus infrequens]